MNKTQNITVRITPNTKHNTIIGWGEDLFGRILKVQVTAQPEKGKANKAMINLLSKEWGIPKSAITIVRGETGRTKILSIDGVDIDKI